MVGTHSYGPCRANPRFDRVRTERREPDPQLLGATPDKGFDLNLANAPTVSTFGVHPTKVCICGCSFLQVMAQWPHCICRCCTELWNWKLSWHSN